MRIFERAAGKRIRQRCATAAGVRPAKGAIWRSPNGRRRAGQPTMRFSWALDASLLLRQTQKQECLSLHRSGAALRAWVSVRGWSRGYRRPWAETHEHSFLVPFVFSANGRPYLKQVETQSGIWFRDARKPYHHRRALVDWPTPEGLQGLLEKTTRHETIDGGSGASSGVLRATRF